MQILTYLLARFSEPSSYAGLGAALAMLGLNLSDPALAELTQFLTAACGLVAMLLKERGLIAIVLVVLATAPALSAYTEITTSDPITACSEYGRQGAKLGVELHA